MRIAYISFEHPLGIAGGGIGTYIGQVANLMANRDHDVEVFAAHHTKNETLSLNGYILHLIAAHNVIEFRLNVLNKFAEREKVSSFTIIESPEYGADALEIKKKFPNIPLIVKLHTPSFLVSALNNYNQSILKKLRFIMGGLIKGELIKPYWVYKKQNDPEYELFNLADSVCSPSNSLKEIVTKRWGNKSIAVIPNPFIPCPELLAIKPREDVSLNVLFLGKLERRKGVIDLMNAIKFFLKNKAAISFTFAGLPLNSPIKHLKMDEYIQDKLKGFDKKVNFKGFVTYNEIPEIFDNSDVCIFPSLWENFPTVCLEAMSAGKAVIGTNNGGMADMIENGKTGLLIAPRSPRQIIGALLKLYNNRGLITQIGINARTHVLKTYNEKVVGEMIEEFYANTVKRL